MITSVFPGYAGRQFVESYKRPCITFSEGYDQVSNRCCAFESIVSKRKKIPIDPQKRSVSP